ncbi:MAG: PspC domain-containing protein [Ruminococcus sp.]|nr:PspC domain-containing protein [Ruminococcus sp.]
MMQKKLYRIRQGRMIAGVCTGLAQYLDIDVNVVRLLAILLGCTGTGLIVYIAACILLPEA